MTDKDYSQMTDAQLRTEANHLIRGPQGPQTTASILNITNEVKRRIIAKGGKLDNGPRTPEQMRALIEQRNAIRKGK